MMGGSDCRRRGAQMRRPPAAAAAAHARLPTSAAPIHIRAQDDRSGRYTRGRQLVEAPAGSIALALFLALFGAACFGLAWLHWTAILFGRREAVVGFSCLGAITLLPGGYHLWIAFGASRGWRGYSYDQIPQM
jgi:hypothetical protein